MKHLFEPARAAVTRLEEYYSDRRPVLKLQVYLILGGRADLAWQASQVGVIPKSR